MLGRRLLLSLLGVAPAAAVLNHARDADAFSMMPEVIKRDYPTTMAELKTMMDAEWPAVSTTEFAVTAVDPKTGEIIDVSVEERRASVRDPWGYTRPRLWAYATTFHASGLNAPGDMIKIVPAFNEEHVARWLWYHYHRHMPASDFATDFTPVRLIWRREPEHDIKFGIARGGYMRIAGVWRDRHGDVVTNSMPQDPIG